MSKQEEERFAEARKRLLPKSSVEMLGLLSEGSALSFGRGYRNGWHMADTLEAREDISPNWMPRVKNVMENLAQRGYIRVQKTSSLLTWLKKQSAAQSLDREATEALLLRVKPINYLVSASPAGIAAYPAELERFQQNQVRKELEQENPRYVVPYRTDGEGNVRAGIGNLYRIQKETAYRFWVSLKPIDGVERDVTRRDRVQKYNFGGWYIEKEHCLMGNITLDQWQVLLRFDTEYNTKVKSAVLIKAQAIEKIVERFKTQKQGFEESFCNEIKNFKSRVAEKDEEGFVLVEDDILTEDLAEGNELKFKP